MNRLVQASLIALAVIALDQASKAFVLYSLMNPPKVLTILPFIDFVLTWNKGVGFGFLKAHTGWGTFGLITLAFSISIGLGIWIWRTSDKLLMVSLSLIIGGAIGNIIDRLQFDGAVVDFIFFNVYIYGYHFPAFNVADIAITTGVCLLIFESYIRKNK